MRRLYKKAELDIDEQFDIAFNGNFNMDVYDYSGRLFNFNLLDKLSIPGKCSIAELYQILCVNPIEIDYKDKLIDSLIDYRLKDDWYEEVKEEFKQKFISNEIILQSIDDACIFTCDNMSEKLFYALLEKDNELTLEFITKRFRHEGFYINISIDTDKIYIKRVKTRRIYLDMDHETMWKLEAKVKEKNEQLKEEEVRMNNLENNMKGINNLDIDINQNNDFNKHVNRILNRMYKDAKIEL